MNKTIIEASILVIAILAASGLFFYSKKHQTQLPPPCPTDVMMCPDGSSVPRSLPKCEFGVCKQDTPSYQPIINQSNTPSTQDTSSITETNLFTKINRSASTVVKKAINIVKVKISTGVEETSNSIPEIPSPQTKASLNETRYNIKDGAIVDNNNTIVYTIPTSSANSSDTSTHDVNAIPIGNVPPTIGAIPIVGLPGMYYLSENTFGNKENCEFSNKIYILDTNSNTRTLMYEENNTTLQNDDPRACNSEIFLLATEDEKIILKYHTIGTNMTCESTWSEPEKTWYLDVTKLSKGTKRYYITPDRYSQAENKEAECRLENDSKPKGSDDIGG